MGLEIARVVDAVGTEPATGSVVLSVLDSWDWSDEHGHLLALQDKLNSYFEFIESSQIYEAYPTANGRPLRIDIICRCELPMAAATFFEKAKVSAQELGVSLEVKAGTSRPTA
jgi:hypothetical protein